MTDRVQLAIYGAGGFGREAAWLAAECRAAGTPYEVVCFIDDDTALHGRTVGGLRVMDMSEASRRFPGALVVGAIGSPRGRQRAVEQATAAGHGFATLVHPRVELCGRVEIGIGTVICAGSILTTDIRLGDHVQINPGCTIGHDAILGDYASLAPGVHVSGWVHLGTRVYVGAGAVIINGVEKAPLTIGDDVIIGAGAAVTRPVAPGLTVVGVPARPRPGRSAAP